MRGHAPVARAQPQQEGQGHGGPAGATSFQNLRHGTLYLWWMGPSIGNPGAVI